MMLPSLETLKDRLSRLHWPTIVIAVGLYAVGLVAIYQAEAFEERSIARLSAVKQIVWGGLAACVLASLLVPHLRFFERHAFVFYGIGLALLVAVLLAGTVKNNAQRWIDLKFMLLQPSEPMKIALVLAVARVLSVPTERRSVSFAIAALLTAVPLLLIVRQPDLGTALLLIPTTGVLVFLSGLRWRTVAVLAIVAAVSAPLVFMFGLKPYQRERIVSFLDPTVDKLGDDYQLHQSLVAIGSGRMTGVQDRELLESILFRVPERQTDFVFSVVGARFGMLGTATLVFLQGLLVLSLFQVAAGACEPFGRLVAAGVAVMLGMQAFLNLAMTIGYAPITGIPLPLVSYGGSSLLTTAVALGLVLNVSTLRRPMLGGHTG